MRPIFAALGLFVALPLFALDPQQVKPPDAIMENVTVDSSMTAVFEIRNVGASPSRTGVFVAQTQREVIDHVCVAKVAPAISFDNFTPQAWTVRFIPKGTDDPGAPCHSLRCSSTLDDLRHNGLCDVANADVTQCTTSTRALGACFGPECDALHANCKLQGDPQDRRCTVDVATVIAACEKARCGIAQKLEANEAGQTKSYSKFIFGLSPEKLPSRRFPSVGFAPESLGKPPYRFILESATGEVHNVTIDVNEQPSADCVPLVGEETTFSQVAVIPLDNTGVASWVYLNPMNPACLTCDGKGIRPLALENRTSDRAFSVSVEFPAEVSSELLGDGCKLNKPCKISRTIQPNNATVIDSRVLANVPEGTLLKFDVTFFDETDKPSNPAAYLRITEKVEDPPASAQSTFVAKLAGVVDPFTDALPDKFQDQNGDGVDDVTGFKPCYALASPDKYSKDAEPVLCAGNRVYSGPHARHYTALARIDLSKPLGRRADISASVNYRTSDFGVDDGNVAKLSEYNVNVYGSNALFLRFGRTTWASPASGIAIFEKGDGYRFAYKYLSLTHVIKRESANSVADRANKDSRSIILQVKSFPINRWGGRPTNLPFFRGLKLLDVTAVRGEDKLSRVYTTIGGEIFYTYRSPTEHPALGTLGGSVAAFRSARNDTAPTITGTRHGEGWVGLATATWTEKMRDTRSGGREPVRTYTFQFGKGSSDRPGTTTRSEDYVGEAAAFSGDTLLMGTFTGKINAKGNVIIGPSLSNKTFLGLQAVDNTFSLLELVADALHVGGDVNSRSTTLRIRQIRFGRPVYADTNSRDAATEYSLDFGIEVPKGIRFTIGGAYMHSGKAIGRVITSDPWVVTSGISLSL